MPTVPRGVCDSGDARAGEKGRANRFAYVLFVLFVALAAGCQSLLGLDEGKARPPSCTDGILNNGESGVDCGGATGCSRCADGGNCTGDGDCASGLCRASGEGLGTVCVSATCEDGEKSGSETDVDCGSACAACGDGLGCASGSDCQSQVCTAGICTAPTCTDGAHNGDEAAVDCGGSCSLCADGSPCGGDGDCASGVCTNNTCTPASCHDGVKNGAETDVDCGGDCPACPVAPSCSDGVQNQDETDVDCGGDACGGTCVEGQGCQEALDCLGTLVCIGSQCQLPSCEDGTQDGNETDVDCGGGQGKCATGECPRCGKGRVCTLDSDCASFYCGNGVCSTRIVPISNVDSNAVRAIAVGAGAGADTRIAAGGNVQPSVISLVTASLVVTSGPMTSSAPIVSVGVKASAFSAADNSFVVVGSYATDNNELVQCGAFSFPNLLPQRTAVFVAKVSAADATYGSCLWLHTFGVADSTTLDQATGVAVDFTGNIFVSGDASNGSFDLDGVGQPINGAFDAFVIKLDMQGTVQWSRFFNGISIAAEVHATGVAAIGTGVMLTGWLFDKATSTTPGSGVVTTLGTTTQGRALLARIDSSGGLVWAHTYGSSTAKGVAVAVDQAGDVLMAASINTTGSFKSNVPGEDPATCGNIGPIVSLKNAIAIAKYSGFGGACLWSRSFGGTIDEQPHGIAVDPLDLDRRVYLTGSFASTALSADGYSIVNNGSSGTKDIFVMALDSGGMVQGVRGYGGAGDDDALSLRLLPCGGGVLLGGQASPPVSFDGEPFAPQLQTLGAFLANIGAIP